MPILQNVLIEARSGAVRLTTTNLDLGAAVRLRPMFPRRNCNPPVKELGRIVRELADMEVSVESSDSPKATISTRGSVFNVVGMESKEFPLPELKEQKEFDLERQEIVSMLKSVSYAQSVNEERYMLKGVFFQFGKDNLSLVATDGRRLAVTSKEMNISEGDEGEFILPSLTVSELEKLPGRRRIRKHILYGPAGSFRT